MEKRKALLQWTGALLIFTLFLLLGIDARELKGNTVLSPEKRPDIITIDTLKEIGKTDRPAVLFPHDLHQKVIEKKGKDCLACHQDTERGLSLKFKRMKEADKQEVMDIYHTNCIGCHKENKAANEKSGPIVCAECHTSNPKYIAAQQPIRFDKSLHFRHTKAQENKCEKCHHEYNPLAKRLFYEKGKEGSCRYCHKETTEENRISMRLASHQSCLECHRKTLAQKKTAGPIICGGCHDVKEQALIKKLETVPRYDRKQPDITLIKAGETDIKSRMNPVPFNHLAHEKSNATCRVCHHEDLQSCVKCHTLSGAKEGKGLNLMQAMHQENAEQSCIGCHNFNKKAKECSGCHSRMPKTAAKDSTCQKCHMDSPLQRLNPKGIGEESYARMLLQSRTAAKGSYKESEIPDKIIIKDMVNKYEEVNFPHRKIVKALTAGIDKSKLATAFHNGGNTVCQGCHHNSPLSKKPPRCGNCHGQPFNEKNPFIPGKMGAYHRQCIGCHMEMGIKKPAGCTECHKERKN
ncbi:MAG: cytochrome C [Deltaproteobacteria bacterium]|nr:cytochrome C [Deltaproteobacteria bacterium]